MRKRARILLTQSCHLWEGTLNDKGYPVIGRNGGPKIAYRWLWELWRGPIPPYHEIHHICSNRCCVNPEHLECIAVDEHRTLHAQKRQELFTPAEILENKRKRVCQNARRRYDRKRANGMRRAKIKCSDGKKRDIWVPATAGRLAVKEVLETKLQHVAGRDMLKNGVPNSPHWRI